MWHAGTSLRVGRGTICAVGLVLRLALGLAVALALAGGLPRAAMAASLTVTTAADELNTDGDCSLREAIRAANLDTRVDGCGPGRGTDTITLRADTFPLALQGTGEDAAATGDLDIAGNLTIQGAGPGKTIVDGGALDRVFHVLSGKVTISDLTIRNGRAERASGGGVLVAGGSLRLLRATVTASRADDGSGLSNAATLLVDHSTVADNGDTFHWGGGIANSGALQVYKSAIIGNDADESGGGIHSHGGTVLVKESVISDNTVVSGDGGGIAAGFVGDGTVLTIVGSTIADNLTSDAGGGGISGGMRVTVAASTISGNRVQGADGDGGGGIDTVGTLVVADSTISGNATAGSGGGIRSGGDASLNNVTIADNAADADRQYGGDGGGVAVAGGTFRLANSIVAGNRDQSGGAPDCSGTLTSQGYNILQVATGCAIGGMTTGNLIGVNPKLGPLSDNGGDTLTHALTSTSPAINAGSPAAPGSGGGACEAKDQRGAIRPRGPRCDIGAYERSQ